MIAPASTGKDSNKSTAVIKTDHTNRGISSRGIKRLRMLRIVVMKLMAPRIELAPAMCSEKIAKSTEVLPWAK